MEVKVGARGPKKRALDALYLELLAGVSHLTWVPGTKRWSFPRAANVVKC